MAALGAFPVLWETTSKLTFLKGVSKKEKKKKKMELRPTVFLGGPFEFPLPSEWKIPNSRKLHLKETS